MENNLPSRPYYDLNLKFIAYDEKTNIPSHSK